MSGETIGHSPMPGPASTRRSKDREWRRFTDYCRQRGLLSFGGAGGRGVRLSAVDTEHPSLTTPRARGSARDTVTAIDLALAAIESGYRSQAGIGILAAGQDGGGEPPWLARPRVAVRRLLSRPDRVELAQQVIRRALFERPQAGLGVACANAELFEAVSRSGTPRARHVIGFGSRRVRRGGSEPRR